MGGSGRETGHGAFTAVLRFLAPTLDGSCKLCFRAAEIAATVHPDRMCDERHSKSHSLWLKCPCTSNNAHEEVAHAGPPSMSHICFNSI